MFLANIWPRSLIIGTPCTVIMFYHFYHQASYPLEQLLRAGIKISNNGYIEMFICCIYPRYVVSWNRYFVRCEKRPCDSDYREIYWKCWNWDKIIGTFRNFEYFRTGRYFVGFGTYSLLEEFFYNDYVMKKKLHALNKGHNYLNINFYLFCSTNAMVKLEFLLKINQRH